MTILRFTPGPRRSAPVRTDPHAARRLALMLLAAFAATPGGVTAQSPATPASTFGVIVMAHGGSDAWNAEVHDAVAPLRNRYPIEVALGMADAASLQAAADRLEALGVDRIAVVRLFVSGDSWRERTEQILGLRPGAPMPPDAADTDPAHGPGDHAHSSNFWRLRSRATFAVSAAGLAESERMSRVLADRARALSVNPRREELLILAHGPGDDAEDRRWVAWMNARADLVREALPFTRVQVMTLREDWPEKREAAIRRIRATVEEAAAGGITTIVLPFRVQGFGPYAEVLEGLDYVADRQGLLPHAEVTRWIAEQAEELRGRTGG